MPCGPSSRASDLANASSPDLAALWAQKPGLDCRERPLLTAMMQPRPASIIAGTTADCDRARVTIYGNRGHRTVRGGHRTNITGQTVGIVNR
mgnify:CR=1 FL=1